MATPEEQAIQGVIDQIWDTYDVDRSGALDKEETKKFVQDTLGNLGSGDEFSQEAFDEVFATFDKDNSGTVEKPEMVVFIKQLLGGNWEHWVLAHRWLFDDEMKDTAPRSQRRHFESHEHPELLSCKSVHK